MFCVFVTITRYLIEWLERGIPVCYYGNQTTNTIAPGLSINKREIIRCFQGDVTLREVAEKLCHGTNAISEGERFELKHALIAL